MKTLVCFGDSNTWGFDPRDPLDCRLEAPWPSLLEQHYIVKNLGLNGRTLSYAPDLAGALSQADCLVLLLGSNDLLQGGEPRYIALAMEDLIRSLPEGLPVLLLGLPPIRLPGFQQPLEELNGLYEALAQRYCLGFLSLSGLTVAYDGVHLTEDSHRLLARMVFRVLEELL